MSRKGIPSDEAAILLLTEGSRVLARRAEVSVRTLRRQFAARGATLADFVLSRRAALTMNLLQGEEISMETAAQQLGFSNRSSFGRFVKREFGQSPRRLQRELMRVSGQDSFTAPPAATPTAEERCDPPRGSSRRTDKARARERDACG